jgi:hypothetical protein
MLDTKIKLFNIILLIDGMYSCKINYRLYKYSSLRFNPYKINIILKSEGEGEGEGEGGGYDFK